MDKVHVKCPGQQLLRGFKFEHRDKEEFRYNFQCNTPSNTVDTTTQSNEWTLWGHTDTSVPDGSLNFLDRQIIDCGNNGYLKSFKIETEPETETLRFVYDCAKIKDKLFFEGTCSNKQTVTSPGYFWTNEDGKEKYQHFSLVVLDGQEVKCLENEALNSFRFLTDYSIRHIYYIYSCCPVF